MVDIGSGAGLPGLPLAMALPGAKFVLLESSIRKCRFIERVVEACDLANVEVVHSRVEQWGEGAGRFEVAMARAVAPLDVIVEYFAPLLKLGGAALAWRGRRDLLADEAAGRAAQLLGMNGPELRRVQPYSEVQERYLYLFSKVRETPPEFPRRPGLAVKRPLGRA